MRATTLLLVMLLVPSGALAQEVAHSFAELEDLQLLTRGDAIWVVCAYGAPGEYMELEAEFMSVTRSTLFVATEPAPTEATDLAVSPLEDGREQVELPANRVKTIARRKGKPYATRALILGGVGAAVGMGIAVKDCSNQMCEGGVLADTNIVLYGALGAGAGIALGLALASGTDTAGEIVYTAAGRTAARFTYSMAPILARHRKGLLFTVTW